jgi:hypothetical protein
VRPEAVPEQATPHVYSPPKLHGMAERLVPPESSERRASQLRVSPRKPASRSPKKELAGLCTGGERHRADTAPASGRALSGKARGSASLAAGGPACRDSFVDASQDEFDDRHAFDSLTASLSSLSNFRISHAGRLDRREADRHTSVFSGSAVPHTASAPTHLAVGSAHGEARLDVGRPDGAIASRSTPGARGGYFAQPHASTCALLPRAHLETGTGDSLRAVAMTHPTVVGDALECAASAPGEGGAVAAGGGWGEELTLDLLSTWGDAFYIGLTALQVFDGDGAPLSIDAAKQVRRMLGAGEAEACARSSWQRGRLRRTGLGWGLPATRPTEMEGAGVGPDWQLSWSKCGHRSGTAPRRRVA